MSFSAHADAKGIMQLIRMAEPRNMLLVHGEAAKMEFLKGKIEQEFSECGSDPAGLFTRRKRILTAVVRVSELPRLFLNCRHRLLHASQRRDGDGEDKPQRSRGHVRQPAEEGDGSRRYRSPTQNISVTRT